MVITPPPVASALAWDSCFRTPDAFFLWSRNWLFLELRACVLSVHLSGRPHASFHRISNRCTTYLHPGRSRPLKSGHGVPGERSVLAGAPTDWQSVPARGPLPAVAQERLSRGSPHNTLPHTPRDRRHAKCNTVLSSSTSNWRREADNSSAALPRLASRFERLHPPGLAPGKQPRADTGDRRTGRAGD